MQLYAVVPRTYEKKNLISRQHAYHNNINNGRGSLKYFGIPQFCAECSVWVMFLASSVLYWRVMTDWVRLGASRRPGRGLESLDGSGLGDGSIWLAAGTPAAAAARTIIA